MVSGWRIVGAIDPVLHPVYRRGQYISLFADHCSWRNDSFHACIQDEQEIWGTWDDEEFGEEEYTESCEDKIA